MAKKTSSLLDKLKLDINEEKIAAIEFFLGENGETVDMASEISAVINDYIDKLYKKKVPNSVRRYIERGNKNATEQETETATTTNGEGEDVNDPGNEGV